MQEYIIEYGNIFILSLVAIIIILMFLLKQYVTFLSVLKIKNQKLNEENDKLEKFVSEYFFGSVNSGELSQIFLAIVDNYTQGKDLPSRFLFLVRRHSSSYKLFEGTILIELDRLIRLTLNKTEPDARKIILTKTQRLNDLLTELKSLTTFM